MLRHSGTGRFGQIRRFLIDCLIVNLAALLVSGALLRWYPKQSGFTVTTGAQTSYIPGGVFLLNARNECK